MANYDTTLCSTRLVVRGGREGGLLLASFLVFILPDAEGRFLKNSAEGRRLFTCWSRRLMKNLCRSLQINFTIPQKEEKKEKKNS